MRSWSISGGAGDTLAALWLAAGMEARGKPITLHTSHMAMAGHFQARLAPWDPSIQPIATDHRSDNQACERHGVSRLDLWAARIDPDLKPKRPALAAPLAQPEWAKGRILAFPRANWAQREWPMHNWRRLTQLCPGILICLPPGRTGAYADFPEIITVADWAELLGAIEAARLVICNDSGPLHAAAAQATPFICLTAALDGRILGGRHYQGKFIGPGTDSVCAPCGFDPARGYDAKTCAGQCTELWSISPGRVAAAVREFQAATLFR